MTVRGLLSQSSAARVTSGMAAIELRTKSARAILILTLKASQAQRGFRQRAHCGRRKSDALPKLQIRTKVK